MPRRRKPPYFWVVSLLIAVVTFVAGQLLMPDIDIEDAKRASDDDFDFPTATEQRVIPVVWGSARIKGVNTIWYGDISSRPIREKVARNAFSSKHITIGHIYSYSFQLGICAGPVDYVTSLKVDDVELIGGKLFVASFYPQSFPGTFPDAMSTGIHSKNGAGQNGTHYSIYQPNLWGGRKNGGGLIGEVQFYSGTVPQTSNEYLSALNLVFNGSWNTGIWGAWDPSDVNYTQSGHPGLCHMLFQGRETGETNKVVPWDFVVHRYPNPLLLSGGKHIINGDNYPGDSSFTRGDSNLMNALYEILTDTIWGLSIPASQIDTSGFVAAADTLFDEDNGFSYTMSKAMPARKVIAEIERQADGILWQDADGKFHFTLIRNDYNPATLTVFDESNVVEVKEFTRQAWTQTVNTVLVNFKNRLDEYRDSGALAQDMGHIDVVGREIKSHMTFTGVKHPDTAKSIASRELKQQAFPLAKVALLCNREAAVLRPGSVIKFTWADYSVTDMLVRVVDIDLGSLTNGQIKVSGTQDMFAITDNPFTSTDGAGVTRSDLSLIPVKFVDEIIMGVPRWFIYTDTFVNPLTIGERTMHLCRRPNRVTDTYDILIDMGGGAYEFSGRAEGITPTAELVGTYGEQVGALGVTDATGFVVNNAGLPKLPGDPSSWAGQPVNETAQAIEQNGVNIFMIGDEIMAFETIVDNSDGTFDIKGIHRGLVDTVPEEHLDNAIVWFLGEAVGVTSRDLDTLAATLNFKHTGKSPAGLLATADADVNVYTRDNRQEMPLRPGYVRVNNIAYPTDLTDSTLTTTWRRRDSATILLLDDDSGSASSTVNTPDTHILEYRRKDPKGTLSSPFGTHVTAQADLSHAYARATYLTDSAGFAVGDRMEHRIFGRDTIGPALDSFGTWTKEFAVDANGRATISTLSLLMNDTAPATDQHYIEGPAFTTLYASNPTVVSFAFWIKMNDTEVSGDMIAGGCTDYDLQTDGFGVFVSGTNEWTCYFGDSNSATGATFVGGSNLLDGSWHHFAATWDTVTNQTPICWVDGVAVTSISDSDYTTAVVRGTGKFDLGRMGTVDSPASAFVDMEMDEVAVYSGILTQANVDQIYNLGGPQSLNIYGPTAGLLLWWRCGEDGSDDATAGSGQITDVGLNGNDYHGTPQASSGDPSFTADVA